MYQTLIKPLAKDIYHFILDTLFPIYCLSCEKEDKNFICDDCKLKLTKLENQYCIVCGKQSVGGLTHPICKTPYIPEGLISVFNYHDNKVADILIKGKYKFLPRVYEILGKMIVKSLNDQFPNLLQTTSYPSVSSSGSRDELPAIIVPLPLHKSRRRWRGFNQSEVLAKSIANTINNMHGTVSTFAKATVDYSLVRCKPTKTQKDLKKEGRIKNVSEAFSLLPPSPRAGEGSKVRGKNIILTDDVVTTGSTLLEAAKVLKRNGAKNVWCLTVARD